MAEATVTAGPIVKWAGGKTALLPALLARLPVKFGTYFEPFAGGAALFFALRPARGVLGDINSDLIATYDAVKADPEPVIRGLRRHAIAHSPEHYYRLRDRWNDQRTTWSGSTVASALVYLNKAGFNGLYRVNRAGQLNVPYGRNPRTSICKPYALRAAHVALADVVLRAGDYRMTLTDAERGSFAYLDSPHAPRSQTSSFTSYSMTSFDDDAQRELAEVSRQLVQRGVHVMLSNADTPYVRSLYKGFKIDRVECPRAINSDPTKRGNVYELIIVGKPSPGQRRSPSRLHPR